MRTLLLLVLAFAVHNVAAGGYQGSLERLWVFYAYQVDGLLPSSSQTIGFKCVIDQSQPQWNPNDPSFNKAKQPPAWDAKNNKYAGKWVSCASTNGGNRCNFNKFVGFLGGRDLQKGKNLVPGNDPNTKTPDIKGTAINYYNFMVGQQNSYVKNFPAQNFLKDYTGGSWDDTVNRVGHVVSSAKANHRAGNEAVFDGFRDATAQVQEARVGDHGPFVLNQARKELPPKGFVVESTPVGNGQSPVGNPPNRWETVDWEKSMDSTLAAGKLSELEAISESTDFDTRFYSGASAEDHRVVLNSYKRVADKYDAC